MSIIVNHFYLLKKIEDLQSRLYKSENEFKRSLFRFENIKDVDEMIGILIMKVCHTT